ncbi:LapA family protein [Sulfidibacter corallicola]|uniref:LapA family protein n=1 Tax=Sulfidibacter corallicola TaxID=2818388 RepID=A0A8A4TT97_SULCO|nr:LapA family protein [Sulfidibacter corallicola]QTD52607.1 LapA family protein [Sulfidibacter corallicola]
MVKVLFMAAVLLVVFALSWYNSGQVITVSLFPFTEPRVMSLWMAILVFFCYGAGVTVLLSWVDLHRLRRSNKQLEKEKSVLENEVSSLRDLMVMDREE